MNRSSPIYRGIFDALPLFVPAIPFALVFGIVVGNAGVPALLGWSSSPLMFGGAAQVTLISLLGEGASVAAAVTASLIVGTRHLLYSVTLAPKFQNQPRWFRWLGSYVLIDQVFAVAVLSRETDPAIFRQHYLSTGFTFWSLWMSFTALGIVVGPAIPADWELTFAAPVVFMGLLTVSVDRWEKAAVALFAMVLTVVFADLPNRTGLIVAAVIAVFFGMLLERLRR